MDKLDVDSFCSEAVHRGYGEYALERLSLWMESRRVKLERENAEMRNSLYTIRKINNGKIEAIDALTDLDDEVT